jgi:hypothetical protein
VALFNVSAYVCVPAMQSKEAALVKKRLDPDTVM